MGTIVTHTSPDWDAIGAVWLLKRYGGMADADVAFVNTGAPDPAVLAGADAVVDTGREYDPARLRFDHHHLPGAEANTTCATLQVFVHLTSGGAPTHPLFFLNQIVALIYSGDTGKRTDGADWSRIEGIHALLSAQKARGRDDHRLLDFGFDLLDLLAEASQARYEAQRTLAQHTVYRSEDGLLMALLNAPQGATFAAHEAGARLVVFQSDSEATYARGVMRAGEWQEPHCGGLVLWVLNDSECGVGPVEHGGAVFMELASWYRHEAGFFAGRGTQKAPCSEPMACAIEDIAAALDAAWAR